MKHWVLVGLLLLFSSCGLQSAFNEKAPSGTGIVGGEIIEEHDPNASSIVAVIDDEHGTICTGTLISSNVVLTAAHCAYQTKAHNIRILFGVKVDDLLHTLEPDIKKEYIRTTKSIVLHPKYAPETHEVQDWNWNDIALLRFRDVHPVEYAPAKLLPSTSWLKVGVIAQMFGYGVSELIPEVVDPKTVENLEQAVEWGEIYCEDMEKLTGCFRISSTGEGELRQAQASIAEIRKTEVVLDESQGHSSCVGDSGGPVFLEKSGQLYLFGITSRGVALCNDIGVYTNVTEFKNWIEDTLKSMK